MAMQLNIIFNDRLKEQLGSGQFGTVYRALWRKETESGGEVDGDEAVIEVAVKSLGKEASEKERVMLLKEAAIMGQFNHPYVVKILGIIDEEPVSELFEFISSHHTHKYLSRWELWRNWWQKGTFNITLSHLDLSESQVGILHLTLYSRRASVLYM